MLKIFPMKCMSTHQGVNSDLGCFVVEENQKNRDGHVTALSYQTSKCGHGCGHNHLVCLQFALQSSEYTWKMAEKEADNLSYKLLNL